MHPSLPAAAVAACLASPIMAQPPKIVVDTSVTGSIVAKVLGDLGEPSILVPANTDLHHYQMRPSDARVLQDADMLVWIGPELTPWLGRAAEAGGQIGAQLELLHVAGTQLQNFGGETEEAHDHDAHDEHDEHHEGHDEHATHADHDDHDAHHDHDDHDHDHDHDHDGVDPHAWLNPENAILWTATVAEELARIDPENAETYRANAAAATEGLHALDKELTAQLAPFADQSFVVFHDAYGYFTAHFGLQPAIAVTLGDATSPSAARLTEVREQIAHTQASCAFPEFAHDPKLVETAIEGSGARIGGELAPAGENIQPGPDFYEDLLRNLGTTLTDCLAQD